MNLQGLALTALLLGGGGVVLDRCAPIVGANHQLDRVGAERDAWRRATERLQTANTAWAGAVADLKTALIKERASSRLTVQEVQNACRGEVSAARKSANAIKALLAKEPKRDPSGCPVRTLYDSDGLHDAVWPEVSDGG
jgi:hypothetical protein